MAITTYVAEDGQRMYLDWETQAWAPVPSEWAGDLVADDDQGLFANMFDYDGTSTSQGDPSFDEFIHPVGCVQLRRCCIMLLPMCWW